jgi:hypothetical protein
VDDNSFDYKRAGKYLAALEQELEGKQAMLEIASATVQSKKQLDMIMASIDVKQGELEEYRKIVGIARQDAQNAEEAAIVKVSEYNSKALVQEESIKGRMDTAQDNLKMIQDECSAECERLNGEVAGAMKEKDIKIKMFKAEIQDAETKRDQALQALKDINKLVVGGAV